MTLKKLDGADWFTPKIFFNPQTRLDFMEWNLELDITRSPCQWMEDFAGWFVPYCLGYHTSDGTRNSAEMLVLDWPWVSGIWRDDVEAADPPSDPLEIDICFYTSRDGPTLMRARYNLRHVVMDHAEDCLSDGSYLSELESMQTALRKLADDLQPAIDAGRKIPANVVCTQ